MRVGEPTVGVGALPRRGTLRFGLRRGRLGVSFSKSLAGLVLLLGLAPVPAWAWGVPGCTNLPEYNRALGALQGMTSACDMSVEEARRVIAAHDGVAAPPPAVAPPQVAPPPRVHRRHRRTRRHAHATRS